MSVNWSWKAKMGTITVRQTMMVNDKKESRDFKVNLYGANCLFAMIYDFKENGKNMYTFYGWFNDIDHLKKCVGLQSYKSYNYGTKKYEYTKSNMYKDEWVKVKLNTFYKDNLKTADVLTKAGFKVELYYKEIKEE